MTNVNRVGVIAALAAALAGTVSSGATPAVAAARDKYVSVSGSGSVCSQASPCSVQGGLDAAQPGDTVWVEAGSYPAWDLRDNSGHLTSASANVTVKPVSAGSVTVADVDSYVAHLTLSGLTVAPGGVTLEPTAQYTVLDALNIDGQNAETNRRSLQMEASHTQLLNSYLHDRTDSDHVFIGNGGQSITDVLVQGNRIVNAWVGPAQAHVDCLQLGGLDSNIRILDNVFADCANSEVIVKADYGAIDNVTVENNVLHQCDVPSGCGTTYYALYVVTTSSYPVTNTTVAHNTIDGNVDLENNGSSFQATGNIIGGISYGQNLCTSALQYNLIVKTGCSSSLPATNRVGAAAWVDRTTLDYHVTSTSAAIGVGGPAIPSNDISGTPRSSNPTAGAYEYVSTTPTPTPTSKGHSTHHQATSGTSVLTSFAGGQRPSLPHTGPRAEPSPTARPGRSDGIAAAPQLGAVRPQTGEATPESGPRESLPAKSAAEAASPHGGGGDLPRSVAALFVFLMTGSLLKAGRRRSSGRRAAV